MDLFDFIKENWDEVKALIDSFVLFFKELLAKLQGGNEEVEPEA